MAVVAFPTGLLDGFEIILRVWIGWLDFEKVGGATPAADSPRNDARVSAA